MYIDIKYIKETVSHFLKYLYGMKQVRPYILVKTMIPILIKVVTIFVGNHTFIFSVKSCYSML